jgi:phage shock protein PspC (stress-responsive transcriptional regulator)
MNRRLYRSRTDSVIGGVAGGVAEYLDVDPSIVRIVWAVLAIVTGGIFFVLYIVMWIVVPQGAQAPGVPRYQPGPGAVPGWAPPNGDVPAGSPPPAAMPAAGETADTGATAAPDDTGAAEPTEPTPAWNAYAAPAEEQHRRRGGGNGGVIIGLILILLGAWFLIDQYVPGLDSDLLWPIALVVIGGALLLISMRRSPES